MGLTWGTPFVTENTSSSPDKNWIVCDDTVDQPLLWQLLHRVGRQRRRQPAPDEHLQRWRPAWSAPATNNNGVIGGQPVVRPDGTVIVPIDNANETAVGAFNSTNGGASWSATTTITTISHHTVAGSLREGPLPSAEIDGAGTVYVVWADCRFRSAPAEPMTSLSATPPTPPAPPGRRSPACRSTPPGVAVDHFIPGLAVNKATSGGTAQLGMTYYFYPTRPVAAPASGCRLHLVHQRRQHLEHGDPTGRPFNVGWAATTSQGRMVGDYISTSYGSDNLAHGVFMTASTPTSGTTCGAVQDNCNEPTDTPSSGLAALGGSASSAGDQVLFGGNNGNANNLWNVVDNNGSKHRD